MKVLVAYDGTLQAKEALRYGVKKVRNEGGEVIALHIFQNSLFIDYDAHPLAEEMARKESAGFAEEARLLLAEEGSDVNSEVRLEEGNPEEEIMCFARRKNIDLLLCPSRYRSLIRRWRRTLEKEGRRVFTDPVTGTGEMNVGLVSFR